MSAIEALAEESSYTRLKEIARGGMGSVELVAHSRGTFRRLLARKRLHGQLAGDEEARAMFIEEARLAGLIRHPNVVSVVDVGVDAEGPYLLMDYVEGITASELIVHARESGEALPLPVILGVVEQVARGLHAAHELQDGSGPLGLIHRDISPQNLLISFDGVAKVTDFGIAKVVGQSTRTSTGVLKGKLGYMAPEVLRFEPLDRRVDLFALGVVLFELSTLGRLYSTEGESSPGYRILNEAPPDLALYRDDLPASLVELALSLLAKDAAARPATALEVADRVHAVIEQVLLVSEDEPVDIATYMREHFVDAAASAKEELRSLEERARLVVPSPSTDAVPSPKARRLGALGWVAAFAFVVLVIGIAMMSGDDPAPVVPAGTLEAPAEVEGLPPAGPVEVRPEPSGPDDPESDSAQSPEPPRATPAAMRPTRMRNRAATEETAPAKTRQDVRDELRRRMDIEPWTN